jgi:hypothetical protein
MIDAKTAKEKATSAENAKVKSALATIETAIKDAVDGGALSCRVNIASSYEDVSVREIVMTHLRVLGYTVNHESGSDQRDEHDWSYLAISWK